MSFSYSYTPDIWPALITFSIVAYLGSYGWFRRHIPAAKPFLIACMLSSLWTLGVILELAAVDVATKVFWIKFQAIWQLPTAATIACFILKFAGMGRWLNRYTYALLFIMPLLSVLFMVTNDLHHLIWTGFQINKSVFASPGRLYWFFSSYIFLLGFLNFVVLIWLAISSPGLRLLVAIIVTGQIFVRIVLAIDKLNTGLIGPGESVFLTIGVMALVYGVALLRFHALDPVAAARNAALQQMREGVLVLDLQDRIADANPMTVKMLGLPESYIHNKPIADLLPVDAGDLKDILNNTMGQTDITVGKGSSARQYRLHLTPLRGRDNEVIGKLILLYDVTEHMRAQTKILKQQGEVAILQERERLARELHDGIAQTLSYVVLQTQSALKWLRDGNNEKAGSLLGRLVEVTQEAHADVRESILSLKTGKGRKFTFLPALKEYMDKLQMDYGIRTELLFSARIDENTFDSQASVQLLRAIQEGLTNARMHSGANTLRVCIELDSSMASISITDDGQGFNVSQFEYGDDEHFGLLFMRERMSEIGGSLKIESIPGSGTALTLNVPVVRPVADRS